MQWLNDNGIAVQAIATAALVLVTIFYAVQTWLTVKRMREQIYNTQLPKVDIERRSIGGEFNLRNFGSGAAMHPITFIVVPSGNRRSFQLHSSITPNEHLLQHIPHNIHYFSKEDQEEHYKVVAVYSDVYGHCFESSRKVCATKGQDITLESLITRKVKESYWQKIREEAQAHKAQEPTTVPVEHNPLHIG